VPSDDALFSSNPVAKSPPSPAGFPFRPAPPSVPMFDCPTRFLCPLGPYAAPLWKVAPVSFAVASASSHSSTCRRRQLLMTSASRARLSRRCWSATTRANDHLSFGARLCLVPAPCDPNNGPPERQDRARAPSCHLIGRLQDCDLIDPGDARWWQVHISAGSVCRHCAERLLTQSAPAPQSSARVSKGQIEPSPRCWTTSQLRRQRSFPSLFLRELTITITSA